VNAPTAQPEQSCDTCMGRIGTPMQLDARRATLESFRFHLQAGTTFKCHESPGRTEVCVAFCRFKRAREQKHQTYNPTLEEITHA
jgi:hypothetical protein